MLRTLALIGLAAAALASEPVEPKLVRKTQPVFPPEVKAARITGVVRLELTVSAEGKTENILPISGHPALADAAVEAVRQWEFEPAQVDGKPVASRAHIEVNFELDRSFAKAPQEVKGTLQMTRLIAQAKPAYPPDAKAKGVSGKVRLRAIIAADGTVDTVRVLDGNPMLVPAAVDAVKQWKYEPARVEGEAVPVITEIDVNFSLSNQQQG